jgi:transcriptional regulator with XRE-family HTH domain
MAKSREKISALQLRKKGMSVRDIASRLNISKGTVSVWCRDIVLTPIQQRKLRASSLAGGSVGRSRGVEVNKLKKQTARTAGVNSAKQDIATITSRDISFLAMALYWAEGAKTGPNFIFVNSDPMMIRLMQRFLTTHLQVSYSSIRPTVQINILHAPRIEAVTKFWARTLGISPLQFSKPYFVHTKLKKIYSDQNVHYGTLRLRIRKSSSLQYRMIGYINVLKEHMLM